MQSCVMYDYIKNRGPIAADPRKNAYCAPNGVT